MMASTRMSSVVGTSHRPVSAPLLARSPAAAGLSPSGTAAFIRARPQHIGRLFRQGSPIGTVRTQSYRGGGGGGGGAAIPDRVVASLPYLLPLFDGLRYGKFLFTQFPAFGAILLPFEPLIRLYFSVPFAGLVAFFAVYLGIINNQSLSRFVRFNAMQAVLLDIILV